MPSHLKSLIARSTVEYNANTVSYRSLPSILRSGLMKRNSAPQKANPSPMRARVVDSTKTEKTSEIVPNARNRIQTKIEVELIVIM